MSRTTYGWPLRAVCKTTDHSAGALILSYDSRKMWNSSSHLETIFLQRAIYSCDILHILTQVIRKHWMSWILSEKKTTSTAQCSYKWRKSSLSQKVSALLLCNFWATVSKTVLPMLSYRCQFVCPVSDVGVLWPIDWMDQDETWHSGRPRPWPHCVRWGPSSTPPKGTGNFRPISVVAKLLDASRCHLVWK